MSRGTRVFLTSGCGGGIGSLVALELGISLWWLGGLVGFLVGYLFYDIGELRNAVPKAWARVTTWKLDTEEVAAIFLAVLFCINVLASLVMLSLLFYFVLDLILRTLFSSSAVTSLRVISLWVGLFCGFGVGSFALSRSPKELLDQFDKGVADLKAFAVVLFYTSPFAFLSYWPARSLIWLVKRGPGFAVMIVRFVRMVFTLIHSELRILCGIDATIGAIVGYIIGNAIIGAFVGGLFGLLNYQIISVRILKIQPARARG